MSLGEVVRIMVYNSKKLTAALTVSTRGTLIMYRTVSTSGAQVVQYCTVPYLDKCRLYPGLRSKALEGTDCTVQ